MKCSLCIQKLKFFVNRKKLLVSTSADWSVRMWSAQFGDFIKKFEGGHEHMVNCLKWMDGCVITGSSDSNICVFDPRVLHAKATMVSHKVKFLKFKV